MERKHQFQNSVSVTSPMAESLTSAEECTCLAPRLLARMHGDTGDDDDDATPPAMLSKLAIISADFSQTQSTAQHNPLNVSTSLNPSPSHHCSRDSDMYIFLCPRLWILSFTGVLLSTTNGRNATVGQDQTSRMFELRH